MSRPARILALLEAARFVPADDLATELDVSRRTVGTEVAALQDLLGTAASISLDDGRYRLMIADPPNDCSRFAAVPSRSTRRAPQSWSAEGFVQPTYPIW